uniref:ADAM metallopeptidase domain 9 n=1 Tax=Monopterus albus TaxID=43700 RepID=A0A3Q3IFY8_MONAL|nr:disintegrin and metalloproteinase domain-containing protein 9-like [Monopterus albus]
MFRKYILFAVFLWCYIFGIESTGSFKEFTTKLSKYSIVIPQEIEERRPPQAKENHEEEMTYAFNIKNEMHHIHLKKNRDFLHPNFVQYSFDTTGFHKLSYPQQPVDCYYHGQVEGYENSVVALSTCSGLRGVIILGDETYGLEPLPGSTTNEHLLYLLTDIKSEPATCGVINEGESIHSNKSFDPGRSLSSLLRVKRNLPLTNYIELVLVVDNLRYNIMKQDDEAIRKEMAELANLLDGYYKQLNIRAMLVGLVTFKTANPFDVSGSAGDVLGRFANWRRDNLVPKIRNDVGHLVVGQKDPYLGGVLGMAFVGTACSASTSAGISVYGNTNLNYYSTVVAHEVGHNLGMNHDRDGCCAKSCIMGPSATGSTTFSSCSEQDFESLIYRGGGLCLRNLPNPSSLIGVPECGNGILDPKEECDCGKPAECTNKCCDAATCKLTFGSTCAQGYCCENCQIKVSGSICRVAADTCDLPEYCNGSSPFCPDDFYGLDGLPCLSSSAYCYEGRCQTYDFQCRNLFSPDPATKAADVCFQAANSAGNAFGNCGYINPQNPIKCTSENVMCGKVQCTNVDVNNPPPGAQVSIQVVQGQKCVNVDFGLGSDVLDPGYVKPGSLCATGKTCLGFKCVDAALLRPKLTCDANATCNGQGVCNNLGRCHCNDGWAPPYCDTPGRGGSIDSGPAMIDYSLRNGLLIFFLLVVPVLILVILVLLYFFKRDSLDPCLKRRPKPRNANTPSNRNVETSGPTQPPVQVPPNRPEHLPEASVVVPGYGELDYWNDERNAAPAVPPAPMQGPGVPRPILSRTEPI